MPYNTPSRRGGSAKKAFTPRKRGLFEDGQWLCECTPRKPALCLTVKKDSPNKGKRFYTCQDNPKKCDFFLWEEEAMKRERDALMLHNCRSENGVTTSVRAKTPEPAPPLNLTGPGSKPAAPTISQYFDRPGGSKQRIFRGIDGPHDEFPSQSSDTEDDVPEPSQTLRGSNSSKSLSSDARSGRPGGGIQARPGGRATEPVTPTAKRKRSVFPDDSDDEFGGDDLEDSDTERQLAAITDESARKQQRTKDAYATPAGGGGGQNGLLPTPVSRRPGLLVGSEERERSAKRQRQGGGREEEGDDDDETRPYPGQVSRDPETPTPYRKTDALTNTTTTPETARKAAASTTAAAEDFPKIADEVMSMLSAQPVSESTKRTLRAAMERHEARVRGIVRGRDAARAGIAERDIRIAELQARIVALENGRKMDKMRLKELSSGLLKLSQEE
ncbi:hypothetical protein KVR01_004849 [Diaporthe batatas]|uniref:uncharacterized protein n=1 Tax=Diaporthe batatas TaxID=748121 RepID=UPI001D03D736|nr:uncharacterized protein KVR01_004849 [Diaporthe batatas]KAG8164574.1 hypothetical protein KVR01_004849 [Diaporthe batatas]